MPWHVYDCGNTINTNGSENGNIILDEETTLGARITLEKDCVRVLFAITCGIYGFMLHTAFAGTHDEALEKYNAMKKELTEFLKKDDSLNNEDDYVWIEQFTLKY